MYKQSQLDRLARVTAVLRITSTAVLAAAFLVIVVALGPHLSLTAQIVLSLGTLVFAWLITLSLMRKQKTAGATKSACVRKYSLDFE